MLCFYQWKRWWKWYNKQTKLITIIKINGRGNHRNYCVPYLVSKCLFVCLVHGYKLNGLSQFYWEIIALVFNELLEPQCLRHRIYYKLPSIKIVHGIWNKRETKKKPWNNVSELNFVYSTFVSSKNMNMNMNFVCRKTTQKHWMINKTKN